MELLQVDLLSHLDGCPVSRAFSWKRVSEGKGFEKLDDLFSRTLVGLGVLRCFERARPTTLQALLSDT